MLIGQKFRQIRALIAIEDSILPGQHRREFADDHHRALNENYLSPQYYHKIHTNVLLALQLHIRLEDFLFRHLMCSWQFLVAL